MWQTLEETILVTHLGLFYIIPNRDIPNFTNGGWWLSAPIISH